MLPWVCVFGGLQRKIETVKMKEKKMKKKKLMMLKTNEKMKSLGQKENQIDEERVIFLQLWMLLGTNETEN
jgi:hypothetical protein